MVPIDHVSFCGGCNEGDGWGTATIDCFRISARDDGNPQKYTVGGHCPTGGDSWGVTATYF